MTSHDRVFMNRIVTRIVEVSNRTITTYGGNYYFYLREREIRREQLLANHRRQQEMLAREKEFIARFGNLGKVWPRPDGGVKSVFGDITGMIRRQGKITVVSVNGAGTSTFRVFEIDHGEMRIYNGHYDYYLEKNGERAPLS